MTKTVSKPQSKPLTHKELKFVQGVAMGKTKRDAALEAYDVKSPEVASVMASETIKRPNVQQALAEAFQRHGIDIDTSTKPIADALKAVKLQEIKGELKALPDHSIRLNASWKAFTLMGMTNNQEGGVTNINFITIAKTDKATYSL